MGDQHPRRLSLPSTSLAGSSLQSVLPLHEARNIQEQSGHELQSLDQGKRRHRKRASLRVDTEIDNGNESLDTDTEPHMPSRKSKSRSPNPRGRQQQQHQANGSTSSSLSSPTMNGSFRERSKNASLDVPEDSASVTARLMGQSSFTLDEAPPPPLTKEEGENSSKGFFELPEQDRRNFLLLVLLYFLQGIPMGLAGGSVPFLLKSYLSYGQIGVYSLASYPYSLKLLWSPIVDAVWSQRFGRRKSWILPIQVLSGFGMIWLGSQAQEMMEKAGANGGAGVWG
ncbi:hypothetical protein KC319_g15747, partial [Hortaea werneckii]